VRRRSGFEDQPVAAALSEGERGAAVDGPAIVSARPPLILPKDTGTVSSGFGTARASPNGIQGHRLYY
jgi:hypothetical protein